MFGRPGKKFTLAKSLKTESMNLHFLSFRPKTRLLSGRINAVVVPAPDHLTCAGTKLSMVNSSNNTIVITVYQRMCLWAVK